MLLTIDKFLSILTANSLFFASFINGGGNALLIISDNNDGLASGFNCCNSSPYAEIHKCTILKYVYEF